MSERDILSMDSQSHFDKLWADASPLIGITAAPRTPPAGTRPHLPAYRAVTDERPWRPGPR